MILIFNLQEMSLMAYVTRQYQAVLQCVEGRDEAAFTAAELAGT